MTNHETIIVGVTIAVSRFTPRSDKKEQKHRSNPFGSRRTPAHTRPRGKRWSQDYTLQVQPDTTLLDCLLTIKRMIDPTLAFRYSCGHGICGSDAVAVNGTPALLCTTTVGDCMREVKDNGGFRHTGAPDNATRAADVAATHDADTPPTVRIEVAPLPGFPVLRDLIVDIDQMMNQIRTLQPYLKATGMAKTTPNGDIDMFEYLQSPEELKRYEHLANCISCGICEGSCPVYSGGEAFIGPAALISASRFINDSRDGAGRERLNAIDTTDGIQACQSVRACSRPCPQGIDVGEEMWKLVTHVNAQN